MAFIKLYVFDVWAWQCLFISNPNNPYDSTLIDCWFKPPVSKNEKTPLDYLAEKWLLWVNENWYILWNLIITNYDFDHFKWIKYLTDNISIWKIICSNNISTYQLKRLKWNQRVYKEIFDRLYLLKNRSSNDWVTRTSSFNIFTVCAKIDENWNNYNTNNLSLITTICVFNTIIVIPWDLETEWWEILLWDTFVKEAIKKADIFVASHHWRDNWLPEWVRNLLLENTFLRCAIISDKSIEYETQDWMTSLYDTFIQTWIKYYKFNWSKITLNWKNTVTSYNCDIRKVLTTRNDWNFVITIFDNWELIAEEFYM